MKKILYIVPILVFVMVALTEDAQAQTQTGNASNAITQGVTGAIVNSAVNITSIGENDVRIAVGSSGSSIVVSQPTNAPLVIFQVQSDGVSAFTPSQLPNINTSQPTGTVVMGGQDSSGFLGGYTGDYKVTITADHKAIISQFSHSG